MALTPCPECETDVSDKATSCPHCGFRFQEEASLPRWSLDRWVKIAQISLPVMIPATLTVLGMVLSKQSQERSHALQKAQHEEAQSQIKADTAIQVANLLTNDDTKITAALLAYSFFQQDQLQPSVLPVLAESTISFEKAKFKEIYQTKLEEMQRQIKARKDESTEPVEASQSPPEATFQGPTSVEDLEKIEEAIEKALKIVRGEVERSGDGTAALKNAAAHATGDLTRNTIKAAFNPPPPDPDAPPSQDPDTPPAQDRGKEAAQEVAQGIAEVSLEAIEQVSRSKEALDEESSGDAVVEARKEAGEEAIRKANAVVRGAIEARNEADGTSQGNQKAETATEIVETVYQQARTALHSEVVLAAESTEENPDVKHQVEEAKTNAELREKLFEGVDLTRYVVVIHNRAENGDPIEPKTMDRLDLWASYLRREGARTLEKNLEEGSHPEVVSIIDRLWEVEEKIGKPVDPPPRHQLRYLAGDSRKETANRLESALENASSLDIDLLPIPSGIGENEFELWLSETPAGNPPKDPGGDSDSESRLNPDSELDSV